MTQPEDAARFTEMYLKYRERVFSYAVTRVGRDLAEEIASEVFLIAWQRIADVPDKPLPWLLVTARNVGSNQIQAAIRQRALAAEMATWIVGETQTGDPADHVGEREALLTALSTLPESDRELLTLTAWHGLSANSAARVIGCSTATYFVRLHRARRRLGQAITAANGEPVPTRLLAAPAGRLDDQASSHDHAKASLGGDQWRQSESRITTSPEQEGIR